jgi:serine/threonine protein kinase
VHGRENFEFRGTKRFEVRRRIGAGGMGIVYEAFDRQRKHPVALKTLRHLDAQALYRLKNEFRALQDLRHPNLVNLGELIEAQGHWFFTMELVNGVDFLSYVSQRAQSESEIPHTAPAAPGARERIQAAETATGRVQPAFVMPEPTNDAPTRDGFDESKLRAAMVGLAQGVYALHEAGKVHRDIKPSNILVTREGRVVLLDFGLVAEHSIGQSSESQVVGTAAYMAPEQAAAKRAGPPADWHSVGVVLYEALTGRLPFAGSSLEILMDKQQHDPPPPRTHVPDVPHDLDALCVDLLRFDPKARPSGREILKRLGADEPVETPSASTSHGSGSQPFVGRTQELELFHRAFEDARAGKPVTVYVHGESGVGKSALIKQFTRQLESRNAGAVVLSGRCYERESMHYKAFDGVVDALSQYMRKLPDRDVGTLLPRNAALLPRVFPVLGRVEVIAHAPQPRQAVKDPRELRTRVFAALRELLDRIAERHPLVITIDDLHWADADSALLLSELLRQPGAPPMLLCISSREPRETKPEIPGDVRRIALPSLDPDSARHLARVLLRRASLGKKFSPSEIAVDARGNPLFIDQLVRRAVTRETGEELEHLHLEEVIWDRVSKLPAPASFVLELVCVAGRPLYQTAILHASRIDKAEFVRHVGLLRVANLVRGRRDGDFETIEPYHNRVSEAVLQNLDEETRKKRHAALAHALDSAGATRLHPQLVLRHFQAAGELGKAMSCAVEAADRAAGALAFDRAADFYRTALEMSTSATRGREIRLKLGEALVNAGHGAEAADVFMEAARDASPLDRVECHRQAAEQLLTTGYHERGLEVLETLLSEVGGELPPTQSKALRSLLWTRLKLRLRGMRWEPKLEDEVPHRDLIRLDVYKTAAHGLAMIDAIRSADFQARGLLLALKTGEETRVGLFLATEAIHVASQGPKSVPRARKLLDEARRIAQTSGSHYLITWTVLARSFLRYFEQRFASAAELLDEVERKILDEATGMSWELSSCRLARVWNLRHLGAFRELRRSYDDYLLDAIQRGDRYTETSLRRGGNVVWLAAGDPDRAESELDAATWAPPDGGLHLQHWWEIVARAEIAIYRGTAAAAATELAGDLARIEASPMLRLLGLRVAYHWIRGRLALASGAETGDRSGAADADRAARALLRSRTGYAETLGLLLRAGAANLRGDASAAADDLRAASEVADRHSLTMHAAAARRTEGLLLAGRAGDRLISEADHQMTEEAIADPARFAVLLVPGGGHAPPS